MAWPGAIRYQLPGWAGAILTLMMIAAFALDMGIFLSTGAEPAMRSERIGSDLLRAKGSAIWPVEGWTYTLMIVPAPLFVLGVYWLLRTETDEGLPAIGLVASVLFWAIHTAHNVAILTVLQVLAPGYVPGAPDASAIEAVSRGFIGFADVLFSPGGGVGTPLWAVASLVFGKALLEAKRLPRWIGYTAIGTALFALLGLLQYVSRPFVAFGLIGWVLFIVWVAGLTFSLLRRQPGPSVHALPQDA